MNKRIKKKKLTIQILQTAKSLEEKSIIFCTYPYGKVSFQELNKEQLKDCLVRGYVRR